MPELRALEVVELRRLVGHRILEAHARQSFERQPVPGEQVADVVLGIVQDQPDAIELVGAAQARDEPLEQLREGAGAQQLQLALLGLAQEGVVASDLLGERGEAGLQRAKFAQPAALRSSWRATGRRPGVRSDQWAGIPLMLQRCAPTG